MNYAEIKYCDIANGVGVRTTLFVSGCRHRCRNCFNEPAWAFDAGTLFSAEVEDELIESLRPTYVTGLSVLGGEPMEPENQRALVGFLERARAEFPSKGIWMYTGFTWEELHEPSNRCCTEDTARILETLDVLVDGRFVQELYDISLRFRGSGNQRLIDVPATLATGEVMLWHDDPVFESHSMDG
ncbi:anaerobic ribonucleoside-triphosphate reductase activating protein [Coriobacteriales bacterium OH1046]|nr:anaerobic ribonucleoside-triphosphate reductase activating protein [Coriobacteriales bacterium OH1046]